MSKRIANKVLLIGWDAADWKVIEPLLASGEMPALKNFLEQGVHGNIASLAPSISPMLWTSIATGMLPYKHGVLGFIEPDNQTGGVRPVRSTSRKVKAVWNILTQNNIKSNVISWWPSNPAEPVMGTMVSNLFQTAHSLDKDNWPLFPGTLHPAHLEEELAPLRVHPTELTEQHIAPFIPEYFKIKKGEDRLLSVFREILAETASVHAAATWLMENEDWEFTAVYYDGIDHFSHAFMKYHPPKIHEDLDEEQFNLYKEVVKGAYKFHDMMLERLLELAGPDTTVILLSDHGFYSDHLRPKYIPKEHAGPTVEHRPYGIFCMKGPQIKAGEKIYGTSLLDITPTILTLFGLPAGKDMDGKPLVKAFKEQPDPNIIESWENVSGECGMHSEDIRENPWESQQAIRQLIELGYIENPGDQKILLAEAAVRESDFNLARSLMASDKAGEALPLLEALHKKYPDVLRFTRTWLFCMEALKKYTVCESELEKIKAKELPDSLKFLQGKILLAKRKYPEAIEVLDGLRDKNSDNPHFNFVIANAYLSNNDTEGSLEAFHRTVTLDADNAMAWMGLGKAYIKKKEYAQAINSLLRSTELLYHNPTAHYHLGEALALEGEYEYAVPAFGIAVTLQPGMSKAHQWLVKLYKQLGIPEKAEEHEKFLQLHIKKPVVLVSGLPRSGTSMMMQMLHAGGGNILTDNLRKPDDNNPKGYFEYEPVKSLARDASWMEELNGQIIKVVAPLLFHVSPVNHYKIIFMEREMEEVLKSQQKMIGQDNFFPMYLEKAFRDQMSKVKAWQARQPNIEVLVVKYSEVVEAPHQAAEAVKDFLGMELDTSAMAAVIDKTLYRNLNPEWKNAN